MIDYITETKQYYRDRSKIYDEIAGYNKPGTKILQEELIVYFKKHLMHKNVLEIASGTGYWTKIISSFAHKITGLDISKEMIDIARRNCRDIKNISFIKEDIFNLSINVPLYNGIFHHFWWSHIPKSDINTFNNVLRDLCVSNTIIVMADNCAHETYKSYINDNGDRIEIRSLPDTNTKYNIIKNLYNERELRSLLGTDINKFDYNITKDRQMWYASFIINNGKE